MQLTEIKNDLATINYSPELNRLMLSDFILIEDANQSILAQVISIEATMEDDVNSAMLKFLLSIDKDANLTQYSGYVPAKGATLILINPQEVVQLIKGNDKNIYIGDLASYADVPVELSLDFLRKRPYIQVDFVENKMQIVESIVRGLEKHNKKTLLFDFGGLYSGISLPTVTLGYNFKLPLNYDALCYIAEEELNDCGNENKAIIQGILIEVQNYVKSTPDEFIPFDTLISVLDAQYEESPLSELLLLKNKLIKYQQQGLFAQEKSEFDFLDTFLKDAKNFKFDLSELPSQWHKIAFVSILNLIKAKCYLITDFMDENSNKTIIKKLYEKTEIKPIVISSYNYKYQLQLKAMSKNMVLFKPIQKVNDFAGYTSFLNILSQDTFIVWGEQTLFIPLILKLPTFFRADSGQKINTITDSFTAVSGKNVKENKSDEDVLEQTDENLVVQDDVSMQNDAEDTQEKEPEAPAEVVEDIPDETSAEIISTEIFEEPSVEAVVVEDQEPVSVTEVEPETAKDDVQEIEETKTASFSEFEQIEDFNPSQELLENDNNSMEQESFTEDDIPNSDDLDFFFDDNQGENETDVSLDKEIISQQEEDNDAILNQVTEENIVENLEEIVVDENLNVENTDNDISENNSSDSEEELTDKTVYNSEGTETSLITEDDYIETKDVDNTTEDIVDNISEDIGEDISEFINEDADKDISEVVSDDITEATVDDVIEDITEEADDNITETSDKDVREDVKSDVNYDIPPAKIEIKTAQTPVYKSDTAPQFDTKFAQGTYVYHKKHGRGVVEKVINYGSKQLCLIIFDNEGRKLLPPNDLKQI